MPVFEAVVGGLGTIIATISALSQEAWTRYFLLLGIGITNNVIQNLTGLDVISALVGNVVSGIFGIQGFAFPIFYGINSFTIIIASYPLWTYLLWKM